MQQRRLIRTRTLAAFRHALVDLAHEGAPLDARRRAIVVPTGAAAELLRQTMEARLRGGARAWPDLVTRAELIDRLAGAVPGWPRLLARTEREVLMHEAARRVAIRPRMQGAPFPLRPGLVAAMLDFYDELRRRLGSVRRLTHALFRDLKGSQGMDRGSESLLHQTSFLGFTYLAYERAARATGALDEHLLRARLLINQTPLPFDHLVVAVADHPLDPRGLWPADFDLLGRLTHLKRLDVVVTDNVHDAGFRDRIESELPGIEESRSTLPGPSPSGPPTAQLILPDVDESICFLSRDREEELRAVADEIRAGAADGVLRDRHAIVFQRPLPYLYLASQVLTDARVPYQAFDAVPLASEPYAATLDVVITAARTAGTRDAAVALLRSRQLRYTVNGEEVTPADASVLDRVLTERRALGDATTFPGEVEAYFRSAGQRQLDLKPLALRAAHAASAASIELAAFRAPGPMSGRVRTVADFLRRHESPVTPEGVDPFHQRRARAAVLGTLDELADAFERHADVPAKDDDPTASVRHAIESRLFTPRRNGEGVHLVDAVAARFGEFDHVHLVGLVETDWPERTRRNLFYSTDLLKPLGWPGPRDQARADRATFADLLTLPSQTLRLSAFQREGDSIVGLSPMLELAREIPARAVELKATSPLAGTAVSDVEKPAVTEVGAPAVSGVDPPAVSAAEPPAVSEVEPWLLARRARGALTEPKFAGSVGPQPPVRYRVSRVDHYVDCPFKYFAENVLGLPEEREEAAGLTPLERGMLVHKLFEDFYRSWMADPGGAITAELLPEALVRFAQLTEATLASLPEADRALERTRLLGSLVAPGIADRVFEIEVDARLPIVRRLLEADLRGTFVFPQLGGLKQRPVEIHGKADRIDVLDDGSLRVIDYKLSRLPDTRTSIQIAVYAHAARQMLEQADGRPYTVRDAMYLAFGDENKFSGPLGNRDNRTDDVVHARVQEFADIIDRIEAGEFPAKPKDTGNCSWCRYAGVCRKEYWTEPDEAAESV